MSNDGWGRPRPRLEDLRFDDDEGSTPARSGEGSTVCSESSASEVEANSMATETPRGHDSVIPLRDHVLPGLDGVPAQELHQTFESNPDYNKGDINRYYTLWEKDLEQLVGNRSLTQRKFTCIFTCPLSGEHFACGHWEHGGVVVDGSTYWYNKKSAKHAAAAKYLDCMSLRRCHGTGREPFQRCLDPPYLEGEGPLLPTLPPGVALPAVGGGDGRIMEEAKIRPVKQSLVDWYHSFWNRMKEMGIIRRCEECRPSSESYSCWSNMRKTTQTGLRFTAIFTCPLTGERFPSGKLVDEEDWTEDHMFYDESRHTLLSNIRFCNANENIPLPRIDLVWYTTKSRAEEAAAGRALDCLRRRDSAYARSEAAQHRYCAEEPYLKNEAPGAWRDVSDTVARAEDLVYEAPSGEYGTSTRLNRILVCFDPVPEHKRITAQSCVDGIHSLVGGDESDRERGWRSKYRQARRNDADTGNK